jgi:hypothetical protein
VVVVAASAVAASAVAASAVVAAAVVAAASADGRRVGPAQRLPEGSAALRAAAQPHGAK